ncbi:MAG: sugar phosphorylase, partial [Treponema sp.]|nr:sugar phosphorylase [Treponema sp.]
MERDPFRAILSFLYGEKEAGDLVPQLLEILEQARPASAGSAQREPPFSHRDAFLISYADMLSPPEAPGKEPGPGETGLSRLGGFLKRRNSGVFSYLHILPFHPYSSDDGFSVIDYRKVDPRYGAWEDLEKLARLPGVDGNLKLAFDFVINHGSVQSPWFKAFLAGEEKYSRWYITRPENYDCRGVTRPRTLPLLTAFTRRSGDGREEKIHVWTTFSADQADYDFSNPQVLLEFVRIFLEYAERGAGIVRLDAIAYLWKEDGHSCVHHPKTHAVVKLF